MNATSENVNGKNSLITNRPIKSAMRKTIITVMFVSVSVSPVQAGSVAGNGGATEVTQILNNVQLVQQGATMLQEVNNTLQMVQMEQAQLKNLINAPAQLWGQAQQDLIQLANAVQNTTAITYAAGTIDQKFKAAFPGFATSAGATNFGSQYKALIGKGLDGLQSALASAGLNVSQFDSERSAIQQIQGISAGSQGSLQAIQAGNMIASQTIDQLQKLRQMLALQTQAQSNFLAAQGQIQANQMDATQTLMKQGNGTVRQAGQSGFRTF